MTLVINLVVGCHYFPSLSSQRHHPLGRYQIILLDDRGTHVSVACPRPLSNGAQPGLKPAPVNCKSIALPVVSPHHQDAWTLCIGRKLVLNTSPESHAGFRSIQKSVTLNVPVAVAACYFTQANCV